MNKMLATDDSLTLTAQRLLVAAVMFPHGAQKLFGWFGGYGFSGTLGYFASLGIPSVLGVLVILGESLGALALAFGLFSRLTALGISAAMLGALLMVHLPNGFFMNWFGNQPGEGIEFGLLMLGLSVPIVVRGGGRFALDSLLGAPIPAAQPA
ncbi:MAG TPA: DoxX family protein [Polyangiales bacterium]